MPQVYEFPPADLSFDQADAVLRMSATEGNTVSIVIDIAAPIEQGNQLDYRMFVESFDGENISVRHSGNEIGYADSQGDGNGSQTALDGGQQALITSEGPCNHVISSFTFDVNPD